MERIRRVSVPVETAAPGGTTNAYLVGRRSAVLVDPPAADADLDAAVEARGVAHVLVTHAHPDHVGGVRAYADRATVWARAGYEDRFERAAGVAPDRTFREGTTVPAGDADLTVLATPGHAPDHVALAVGGADADGTGTAGDSAGRTLLVGDLAMAEGSVVVGAPEGDVRAYLTALRRLHARAPARLLPGHGPAIEAPRPTLERLLAHRLDREGRVRRAVESGATTVAAVTDAAYGKDVSAVRDLAERTVRAHLEKLAVEGRVERDGDEWRPAD